MSRPTRFFASTVESAVHNAEQHFGKTSDTLEVSVIQKEKRNFFGYLKERAIVEVRLSGVKIDEAADKTEQSFHELIDDMNFDTETDDDLNELCQKGKVWVQNGKLHVKDGEDNFPVIEPATGVKISINGQEFQKKQPVKESDDIVIDVENERIETKWKMAVDNKGESVVLSVDPGYFLVRTLKDHSPAEKIKLVATEKKQMHNQLLMSDILSELEKYKVTYGIDYDAIQRACATETASEFVIALARPPVNGKDGEATFKTELESERTLPQEHLDGSVDHRETYDIPSVEEGEVIAAIQDPEPGKDGIDIYGRILTAKDGKELIVKPGKGVSYLEGEQRVVATDNGRPHVDSRGRILRVSVLPCLVHSGDVNIETGNLDFVGDIDVQGSVEEGMRIEADGSIWVKGYVDHSKIRAGYSATIQRNVINSTVVAGNHQLALSKIGAPLETFLRHMKELIHAIRQIQQAKGFKQTDYDSVGLSSLIQLLTEQKMKALPDHAKLLVDLIDEHEMLIDQEWLKLRDYLHRQFILFLPRVSASLDDLVKWHQFMQHLYESTLAEEDPDTNLTVGYATNSHLYSSGHIHVTGRGCINSILHGAGEINIAKTVAGGEVRSGSSVSIKTSGSMGGAKTVIQVPEDGEINISYAYTDTIIYIGHIKHHFYDDAEHVQASLNKDGTLNLQSTTKNLQGL
ncbi:hypothetical protein B0H94_11158 [Salsuginibacillus halophilus]|uniref:RNA-binding protein KhpB N-terminal domain-containing protein n=1 Tax=Salsuginibacillus halophilus TaxID=517424 RepID=A0A2P8HAI2_9BACI|nr:flagellar assembly protein A [Salsuginibacillus halophilus]PSL43235.1 hypothetical protein B0H94_11158 [Salsuginibacillus halophilus]